MCGITFGIRPNSITQDRKEREIIAVTMMLGLYGFAGTVSAYSMMKGTDIKGKIRMAYAVLGGVMMMLVGFVADFEFFIIDPAFAVRSNVNTYTLGAATILFGFVFCFAVILHNIIRYGGLFK